MRLRQNPLEHQRIDVDHAILQQVQCQHAHLVVFPSVARQLSAPGEKDKIVSAIPLLDHVEALVNFTAERLAVEIAAQEDRFDRPAEFDEALVGRMLDVCPGKSAQDRFRFRRAKP